MHDVFPRQPAVVRIVAHGHVDLRGNDDTVSARSKVLEGATENLFALPDRIHVGCIEIIDAEFESFPNERPRFFLFQNPWAPLLRVIGHGAKAQTRNFESSRSKIDVFHSRKSLPPHAKASRKEETKYVFGRPCPVPHDRFTTRKNIRLSARPSAAIPSRWWCCPHADSWRQAERPSAAQ